MTQTIASHDLPAARPNANRQRLITRMVHLGCGAFHRAHQALYAHELNQQFASDWGISVVNLRPSGKVLIAALNHQDRLYTVAEKGAQTTQLKIVGAITQALHPQIDGVNTIVEAMAHPQTAIVSLTVTEKGYCTDAASGELDLNHPQIKADLAHPQAPVSAIGYLVEALARRRERGLPGFSIMSCDNLRNNGQVARAAVIGLARARDSELAEWIVRQVTFPGTMVDRIVPAATPQTLAEIAQALGVNDPCAIACEPFRQWVIEDNFVNGRPAWEQVGVQLVTDVAPFEHMKLRMLNGSHSFLAYLGYLAGYQTIADTMADPAWRRAVLALMIDEQAPTLTMPPGTDLAHYSRQLIARFSNPALRHLTGQIAMDGSQKLPQRLLDSVRQHLARGSAWRHLALGIAGWMRYVAGIDEQGKAIEVVDPLLNEIQRVNQQYQDVARVAGLLAIPAIFGRDLPANGQFVEAVTQAYQRLSTQGAQAAVAALSHEANV